MSFRLKSFIAAASLLTLLGATAPKVLLESSPELSLARIQTEPVREADLAAIQKQPTEEQKLLSVQQFEHDRAILHREIWHQIEEQRRLEAERLAAEEAERRAEEQRQREAEAAARANAAPAVATGSVWDRLAQCESNGQWDYGPHSGWGNGLFEGGLQFHPGTWDAYKPAGYPEAAYQASRAQQIAVAEKVLASQGWGAWPSCSRKLGLR